MGISRCGVGGWVVEDTEGEGDGAADDRDNFGDGLAGLLVAMVVMFVGVPQTDGISCNERVGVARVAVSLPSEAITPSVANIPSVAIMPISASQHRNSSPSLAPRDVDPLYAAVLRGWWLSPPWLSGGGASPRRQLTNSTDTNCFSLSKY